MRGAAVYPSPNCHGADGPGAERRKPLVRKRGWGMGWSGVGWGGALSEVLAAFRKCLGQFCTGGRFGSWGTCDAGAGLVTYWPRNCFVEDCGLLCRGHCRVVLCRFTPQALLMVRRVQQELNG